MRSYLRIFFPSLGRECSVLEKVCTLLLFIVLQFSGLVGNTFYVEFFAGFGSDSVVVRKFERIDEYEWETRIDVMKKKVKRETKE